MQTQTPSIMTSVSKNLHQLVGLAAGNSMPIAVQRNSFIVNEVPHEFQIATDEKVLANVLDSLLSAVVNHSKHSCIRIKAKEYDDMVFVYINDNSSLSNYDVTESLEQVQLLAKKMNGTVTIQEKEEKFTTILLSFPNFPKAA